MRDEVEAGPIDGFFVGVASWSDGGWNRLPNGEDFAGVELAGDVTMIGALMVGTDSATSAAGVDTGLSVSKGTPDAAALASLRLSAFALARASRSSVAWLLALVTELSPVE